METSKQEEALNKLINKQVDEISVLRLKVEDLTAENNELKIKIRLAFSEIARLSS
jgi:FtsZ-binding cell division protein ZapB